MPDYSPIPTSALIMLANLILKRARLSLLCGSRTQALSIVRGVRPAPSRHAGHGIRPHVRITRCTACQGTIEHGSTCNADGNRHIDCEVTNAR